MATRKVTLRMPAESDTAAHAARPYSAEISRMYGGDAQTVPCRTLSHSMDWLAWLRGHPFAQTIDVDGVPSGAVRLHTLAEADRRARLAIGLFAESDLGKGIGRHAIGLTLDHAFGEMCLHRIDLRVLAYNVRAIRCYLACGCRHEGTEREAARVDGAWHDDWIMGILAREHRG